MTAQQSFTCVTQESAIDTDGVKFTLITAQSALTATLSALIQAKVAANDSLPPAPFEDMTVFHALEPPAISVADYVARVSKYVFCSEACLVAAYHYINKAVSLDPKLALNSLSVHRLFITAVVLACKYFDDVSYNLMYYAKVGGLPYKELANLERHMLRILDFRLDIPAEQFVQIESEMMVEVARLRLVSRDINTIKLVKKAFCEFDRSNIVPVEFEALSDEDTDSPVRTSVVPKQPFASPTMSAVTEEGSMSRNSSLASLPEDLQYYETSVAKTCTDAFRKAKALTDSPTTPGVKGNHARRCGRTTAAC